MEACHPLCSPQQLRAEQAAQQVQQLQEGGAALTHLEQLLEAVHWELQRQREQVRGQLQQLQGAQQRLQDTAAQGGPSWQGAQQAARQQVGPVSSY